MGSHSFILKLCCLLYGLSGWIALRAQDSVVIDDKVKVYSFTPLEYPQRARIRHEQGTVVVRVTLDKSGRVLNSSALSGPETLIGAAADNAKKWRFQANSPETVILVYRFEIRGLCQLPCQSQFLFEPPNFSTIVIGDTVIDHPPSQ